MISPTKFEIFAILTSMLFTSACVLFLVMGLENTAWRIRRCYLLRLFSLWLGITVGLTQLLELINDRRVAPLPKNFHKEWRLYPNGVILPKNSSFEKYSRFKHLEYSDKPVIFITPTEYSAVQSALLTRLGQALFPMRHLIKWIIVQLPLDANPFNDDLVGKKDGQHVTFHDAVNGNREELTQLQMKRLHEIVSRFGIPYKLLSSDKEISAFNTSWAGFYMEEMVQHPIARGYLVGLLWAVKSLSGGVIIMGDEQFVYNSALFWELRKTRTASCWPVAFESENVSLSFPIADTIDVSEERKEHNILNFVSDKVHVRVPVQRSGFAIDLEYLQNAVPYKDYWKLVYDFLYTNANFFIQLQDIQVLGNGGSEIYVWKLTTEEMEWPKRIKFRRKFSKGTNVNMLLESTLGIRLKVKKNLFEISDNFTVYDEYDMNKHVKGYL